MASGTRSYSAADQPVVIASIVAGRAKLTPWLALLPVLVYLCVLYANPLAQVLWQSISDDTGLTFQYYTRLVSSDTYARILLFTFELGAGVTIITLLLGYPFAYALTKSPPRLLPILLACVLLPFWTSVIVRTFTWLVLLERNGIVNQALLYLGIADAPPRILHTKTAVYIGLVYYVLPFVIVSLYSFLKGIDPGYMRSAQVLGARPIQAFCRVYFPLSLPGVVSSGILAFVLTIGFYITPAILGGLRSTTIPMLIEQQINSVNNWHFASALAVVLLVTALLLNAAAQRLGGGKHVFGGGSQSGISTSMRSRLTLGDALLIAFCVCVLAYLILPIAIIVIISFTSGNFLEFPVPGFSLQWYSQVLNEPKWVDAGLRSVLVAAATVCVSGTLGTLGALAVSTNKIRGAAVVRAFILSPLIIPKIISAVVMFLVLSPLGMVGTDVGLVAGHTILALPFVFIVMSSALIGYDRNLNWASMSLGATPIQTFRYVMFPILLPSILAAGLFAFLESFDDVIVALFVSGIAVNTLPKLMFVSVQEEITPSLAAVSAILVGITVFAGAAIALLVERRGATP